MGKVRGYKCYGELIGIRIGDEVVDLERGKEIFESLYEEVVREKFGEDLEIIRKESMKRVVVLLDYEEGDERKCIDGAGVLKRVLEECENEEVKGA